MKQNFPSREGVVYTPIGRSIPLSLTLIGFVVIVAGLVCFCFAPTRLPQGIVFFSSFSGTAVINFTAYGMSPAFVLTAMFLGWLIASGEAFRPVRAGRDHLLLVLMVVVFASVCVVSLLFNGGLEGLGAQQVTQTAYLLFGVTLTLALSFWFARADRLEAGIRALRAGATFIALWGIVQAVCFYAGLQYPAFLFNNSTSKFADMFDQRAGNLIRIASVGTEPSLMASSLMIFVSFGATLLVLDQRFRTRVWVVPVALTLLTVLASTSSTGYFGIAVLMLLLGLRRPGPALAGGIGLALLATIALAVLPELRETMYGVTFGKSETTSYGDRTAAIVAAIDMFRGYPWIGRGWGSDYSYSIVTQLLANTGVLGTAAFAAAIAGTLLISRGWRMSVAAPSGSDAWRYAAYAMAAETALLVCLSMAAISGFKYVVADFWCLWGFAIALPSCIAIAAQDAREMPHITTRPAVADGRPNPRVPALLGKPAAPASGSSRVARVHR